VATVARILLWVAVVVCLLFLSAAGCEWSQSQGPLFEREPSPTGAYEVVWETASNRLDSYTTLCIARRGEMDAANWQMIAPMVDGTYHTDWLSPAELVVTNYGWPQPTEPHSVRQVFDVQVEVRGRPSCVTAESPRGRHRLDVWTYNGARGQRSGAIIAANWNSPEPGGTTICAEGPWEMTGKWVANDHVELQVAARGAAPSIPPNWRGIRITVVER